ncbi:SAM-dependent methyltransferase [Streptomyces avicenniae]|uniref:SAM-dependent methyltransferase n=1 Tax=Streptomyces avicenniae TaxID=500153 RepID=UPI00069A91B5|nr:cyclopropane-fatty-acyl-phospholipid synthase family protein [Streptomyces avicenniae]
MKNVAAALTDLLAQLTGARPPVRIRAWDGSQAGPPGAPLVILRTPRALRRLLWQPDELGLAQAYVTGELDVEGDLAEGLRTLWSAARAHGTRPPAPSAAARARAAVLALRTGALGPRPPAPASQARLTGTPHTTSRDRAAISHHYDLSNDFYALLLDPAMAYSCGYWTSDAPDYGLADAQRDKLELICRKLRVEPDTRLLDVGCGWGSLTLYAAERHKARVDAITLSAAQRDHVQEQVRARGLEDRVRVELRDYRAVLGSGYDAVATVEMGEHVGEAQYPGFAAVLHRALRPQGRLLVQQMSRGANAPGGGPFIEAYIAPDMHMRPLGTTVGLLEEAGLEVRAAESLREHYAWTIDAWRHRLEEMWPQAVDTVGEEVARVWRLYLAGSSLAFSEGRMGVDQILAVRPADDGSSGLPPTPHAWYGPDEHAHAHGKAVGR